MKIAIKINIMVEFAVTKSDYWNYISKIIEMVELAKKFEDDPSFANIVLELGNEIIDIIFFYNKEKYRYEIEVKKVV